MQWWRLVREDFRTVFERDPATRSKLVALTVHTGFWSVAWYRLEHALWDSGFHWIARWLAMFSRWLTGVEIHPAVKAGRRLFIDHGMGIVIGETAELGDNVTLFQGVTLGGTGKEHGKRHPTVGNNVMICSGAKVLGSFKVGDNSKIGAGSVVLEEVPPNSTVVGVPGRVVKRNNVSLPQDSMDQYLPDPVREDIVELQRSNTALTNRLIELEEKLKYYMKEAQNDSNI